MQYLLCFNGNLHIYIQVMHVVVKCTTVVESFSGRYQFYQGMLYICACKKSYRAFSSHYILSTNFEREVS